MCKKTGLRKYIRGNRNLCFVYVWFKEVGMNREKGG